MRKERSKRNLITGLLYQIINTLLALILPHLFITSFGSETNGLLSSIGQLFVYLGLLEAGVGAATIQALYKPVANHSKEEISAVLSATNQYYVKTGAIYTGAVLVLAVVYPFLVDSSLNNTTIRLVILLQGAGQVVGYFTQAKYALLLRAEGKNYFLNVLMLVECILRNTGKIAAIALGYGIVVVQAVHFVLLCLYALVIVLYIRKKYSWINLHEKPNYKSISQKNSVLIQSIAWIVFNHTDIMVLTVITRNLALVSVYSVYALLFEAIQNINNTVRDSFQYKLGYYSQRSKSELTDYYCKYSTVIFAFTYACFGSLYFLSAPFVRLYTAGVTDADYMIRFLPELFTVYKILYCMRATNRQLIEAGGFFKATEGIAIREAIINIGVSVILVFPMEIYGVLIGTLVALVYSVFAYTSFVKKRILEERFKRVLFLQYINMAVLLLLMIIGQVWHIEASSYVQLIARIIPLVVLVCLAYGLAVAIQLRFSKKPCLYEGA